MAPRKLLVVVVAAVLLLSSSLLAAGEGTGTVEARDDGYLGDGYIGCLELGFSRCFDHPTVVCIEDAMVECSLQTAAAAPAAGELFVSGAIPIIRGIAHMGAAYIQCVELDMVKECLANPTMKCVEKALGGC